MWVPDTPNGSTGRTIVLDALEGSNNVGSGTAINDDGVVVGYSIVNNHRQPFVWKPNAEDPTTGVMAALPLPAGVTDATPFAINNRGEVVSFSNPALLWTADGAVFDLNTLVTWDSPVPGHLTNAYALNDAGQIIATASYDFDRNGTPESHYVLLTPAPEPSAAATIIATGILALARRRRRRT
jgi:uncharacterized membrane protein